MISNQYDNTALVCAAYATSCCYHHHSVSWLDFDSSLLSWEGGRRSIAQERKAGMQIWLYMNFRQLGALQLFLTANPISPSQHRWGSLGGRLLSTTTRPMCIDSFPMNAIHLFCLQPLWHTCYGLVRLEVWCTKLHVVETFPLFVFCSAAALLHKVYALQSFGTLQFLKALSISLVFLIKFRNTAGLSSVFLVQHASFQCLCLRKNQRNNGDILW